MQNPAIVANWHQSYTIMIIRPQKWMHKLIVTEMKISPFVWPVNLILNPYSLSTKCEARTRITPYLKLQVYKLSEDHYLVPRLALTSWLTWHPGHEPLSYASFTQQILHDLVILTSSLILNRLSTKYPVTIVNWSWLIVHLKLLWVTMIEVT